jgi:uncharacterized protein YdaU (DUF1376 family)
MFIFDLPVNIQLTGLYVEEYYDNTASVSRNTFGILLLAVYDLYFAQQFIDSSADCIIVNALS